MKKFLRLFSAILLVCMLVPLVAACNMDISENAAGGTTPLAQYPVEVKSISLNTDALALSVGSAAILKPKVLPAAADQTVIWTSSDTTVAEVAGGVVVGISAGTATIFATTPNEKVATCAVLVTGEGTFTPPSSDEDPTTPTPENLLLSSTSLELTLGGTATLHATVLPNDAAQAVAWISANNSIASVENGTVTALSVGTTAVVACAENGKFSICTVTVTAPTQSGLQYTAVGNGYQVSTYNGSESTVTVPATYEGKPVLGVATNAFLGCTSVTQISLPNSITFMEKGAFYGCSNLTTLTLPFVGTQPNAPQSLGFLFGGTDASTVPAALKTITLTGSESIPQEIFSGCEHLTTITLTNATRLEENAFANCTNLTTLTLPATLTDIRMDTYVFCSNIASLSIVGEGGRYYSANNCIIERESKTLVMGCKNSIIPNDILSIGKSAFGGCIGLTSIEIPASVTFISDYAFYNCSILTTITFAGTIPFIDDYAFSRCEKLMEIINLGDTPLTIGGTSNGYLTYRAKEIHNGTSKVQNENDFLFYTYGGTSYLMAYCGTETNITLPTTYAGASYEIYPYAFANNLFLTYVTIPEGITTIPEGAFSGCKQLIGFSLPSSLTSLGANAFSDCTALTSATLPDSLLQVSSRCFSNCINLETVNFGKNLTTISSCAFNECYALRYITIPASVTFIENHAFYYCEGLVFVTFEDTTNWYIENYYSDGYNLTDVTNIYKNAQKLQTSDMIGSGWAHCDWKKLN